MTPLTADAPKAGHLWYVVITHLNQERLAKAQLERQDYDVYLPMVPPPATSRVRNGIAPGPRPMIPRYMFVSVDITKPRWRSILSTVGVHDLLMRGSGETARPNPIPNRFIEEMQNREVNGLVILPPRLRTDKPRVACPYRKGDKLRWTGPTADYDLIFEEMVDGDRAAVLFKLLGRDSRQIIALPSD